ncbi:MAG: tetratricopeptide repeat protein, partial [Sarcina sp.]
ALDTYNKLLKEQGENIIILGEIAWNYHKDKDYEKALEFYDRALKQEENKLILAKKVKVLFDMNMLEKGIQLSKKVIDNLDDSMQEVKYDLITNVALAYLKVKNLDKAVESLELCLDYEPIRKKTLEKLIEIFKIEKNKEMVNKYRKLLADS